MTVRLPSFSKMKLENVRRLAGEFRFTLASGSPRRRKILNEVGISFEVIIPDIEEICDIRLPPEKLAIDLAQQKLASITATAGHVYLSCDTIVVLDGELLTKPLDVSDARRILFTLSGRTHSVYTGLALCNGSTNKHYYGVEESRVRFHKLDARIIDEYIASGEPLDKAGAYGIQGMGGFFVDSIEGNIDNVIGLPLAELELLAGQLLDENG